MVMCPLISHRRTDHDDAVVRRQSSLRTRTLSLSQSAGEVHIDPEGWTLYPDPPLPHGLFIAPATMDLFLLRGSGRVTITVSLTPSVISLMIGLYSVSLHMASYTE